MHIRSQDLRHAFSPAPAGTTLMATHGQQTYGFHPCDCRDNRAGRADPEKTVISIPA